MIIPAKSFLFPSVAAHGLAIVLVLIVMWRAPTFKTAKPQMIRVRLTQAAVKPMPTVAPAPTPPTPSPKPTPTPPKPKPTPPPPKPKPTPPKPKPTPPPPKPVVKPTTRTVMPTPKQVLERQKQWEEAQKKKRIAKTAATNVAIKIVKRPPPKKVEIAAVTPQVNTAFEEARKRYEDWQNQKDAPAKPAAAPPTAPVGPQSSPGEQAAIIDDFFCNGIRTAIDRVWRQPPRLLGSCEVTFRLTRDGRVADVRVSKAGPSELNKSALDAVQNAQFPPFPANLHRDYLDLEVPFEILGTE